MPILHLTSKRNQRDFAWAGAMLADREEPTWPEILEAVVAAAGDPGPLYLIGGEPTLRRDLFVVLMKLAKAFPQRDLVLVTNGRIFFYEQACEALATVQAERLTLEVLIASTRREVHDEVMRVANSFDQASKGIQQLLARGQRTRVRVLVGRHNIEHLHELVPCIGDRFTGIDAVVWDVTTLAGPNGGDLSVRPDQVSSPLESALNLLLPRRIDTSVVGMPTCTLSQNYRGYIDRTIIGVFRDECAACEARAGCPGLAPTLAADPAFQVRPVVPISSADAAVEYERYLVDFLSRYVPPEARLADTVLDAMCGQPLRNLPLLRQFFGAAHTVHGADIELDRKTKTPVGTSLFRADLFQPLRTPLRYALIALFKPPSDKPELPIGQALTHLIAALQPGGHLLIVLAEHTEVEAVVAALKRLDVTVLTSESNALRTNVEPQHKWIIVCRAGAGVVA